MEARSLHLEGAGLAQRRGTGFLFARDLITTLKGNELSQEIDAIARRTGLAHQPSAAEDYVSGVYREIGRAHVCTPVTNAHLVCRLLLDKKTNITHNPIRHT